MSRNTKSQHLSVESFHKLNRAANVAFQMHLQLRTGPANIAPLLLVPDVFSYLSEDIRAVLAEVKALGLCDDLAGNERIGQVTI